MMLKKRILLGAIMLMSLKINIFAGEVNLYLNGVKLGGADPISLRNTTFVPIGVISRELDLDVEWNNPSVEISNNVEHVKFNIDDINAYKGKEIFFMREAPFLYENRVYVPLRAVSELFGYSVKFSDTDKSIDIRTDIITPPVKEEKIEFERSPNLNWGIWNEINFYNNHQYKSLYLRDFSTGKSYKLNTTHGFETHHWTPQNKIIFSGLNAQDEGFVHIFDPEQMKTIETISTRIYDYDFNMNKLYYYKNNTYIAYDLDKSTRKEISRDEYIQLTQNL